MNSPADTGVYEAVVEDPTNGGTTLQPIVIRRPSHNWTAYGIMFSVVVGFSTVIYQRAVMDTEVGALKVDSKEMHETIKSHDAKLEKIGTTQAVQVEILKEIQQIINGG